MNFDSEKHHSHDDDYITPKMKVDPYRFSDPQQRSINYQLKKFDINDVYIILGVFIIGFVFAMVLSNYYKLRKEKIDEISRKFQGLKGEYELVQDRLESFIKWKYRVKVFEKIFLIILLSIGFLCYKSPSLLTYFFVEHPVFSIPALTFSVVFFSLAGFWLDKSSKDQEKRTKKLKEKLKDTKRMLVSHMDPSLVEAVKEIVRNDMREEIDQMKNSKEGCSIKCRLTNQMNKIDIERNQDIVNEMINFKWCDNCKQGQPGAVHICNSGCGHKLFKQCLPLMKTYGEKGQEIAKLQTEIKEITQSTLRFKEYQKAKKDLEYEHSKKSQTYNDLDKYIIKSVQSQQDQRVARREPLL